MSTHPGTVYLVGAGPGDAGLITVRGQALLQSAAIIVHDRLIGEGLLAQAHADAQIIDVGKAPGGDGYEQQEINDLLVTRALQGSTVVRLKGGDPFIFGRGWEELRACREAGVPCVVVPGLSSALAVPAAVNLPLTLRGISRSVGIVTAQTGDKLGLGALDHDALARIDTVVVLMGRANLRELAECSMRSGRTASTPVACIERGTLPVQRVVVGDLATIADRADQHQLQPPIVTVIGEVARHAEAGGGTPSVLAGRQIFVTRPRARSTSITHALRSRGAKVIDCPLLEIQYPSVCPDLQALLQAGLQVHWTVFSSVHAVEGFWRQLERQTMDARALGRCRVAAVGPMTARALTRHGIRADLVPAVHTAAGLLDVLRSSGIDSPETVLLPRGNMARRELPDGLAELGATVVEAVVYHTVRVEPAAQAHQALCRGGDAVIFYSPSAVRSFVEQNLQCPGAAMACIGPTTADDARRCGLAVDILAAEHSDEGMLRALEAYFASSMECLTP